MPASKLGSTLSGSAPLLSDPGTSALDQATMLSGRFASELGTRASEDLRRKWVEFRMQELQEKEANVARSAEESAAKKDTRRRRKEKKREESAPPAPSSAQSGILGPAPWTTLPVDSLATEAFRRREASAPAKPSSVKWGRFDYAGEAAMYPTGDVHVSIRPRSNVEALHGPVEKGLPRPGYVVSQPFGGPKAGELKIGQGLVRQTTTSAFKQPLSQALNNAGVYQASTWATTSQDFGAFRPVLKWARSQGEWNADRRQAESAMQPDLP